MLTQDIAYIAGVCPSKDFVTIHGMCPSGRRGIATTSWGVGMDDLSPMPRSNKFTSLWAVPI